MDKDPAVVRRANLPGQCDPPDGDSNVRCAWRSGVSPLLVIAPHAGRRSASSPAAGPRPLKVNDLHTAEIALLLADRLGASLVVNENLDRNHLDLNRLSQVRRKAPWFLALIDDLLAAILTRHEVAEVLFVHGWNVTPPRCDIGIGAPLRSERAAYPNADLLTVSPRYVGTRLQTLRHACHQQGIQTTYGQRYPGSHSNNLLQIFRATGGPSLEEYPRLRRWAAEGRIQAIQLELGAAIRWPGTYRERFLTAAGAFGGPAKSIRATPAVGRSSRRRVFSADLQFYDPRGGVGLVARVHTDPHRDNVVSRLLVFLGGQRVALFTGESRRADPLSFESPRFTAAGRKLRLEFDGPLLEIDDGRRYLDLENALSQSRLSTGHVDLALESRAAPGYGRVTGQVRLNDRIIEIDAYGFRQTSVLDRHLGSGRPRSSLSAAFGPELAVYARSGPEGEPAIIRSNPLGEQRMRSPAVAVSLEADRLTPRRFTITAAGTAPIIAEPMNQMAIRRPIQHGGTARITFGVARFLSDGAGSGFGFYEYVV